MKHAVIVLMALASPASANPFADGFADRACTELRHAVAKMEPARRKAPIAVTVVDANDNPTGHFFRCGPLPGGEHLKPVNAEAAQ